MKSQFSLFFYLFISAKKDIIKELDYLKIGRYIELYPVNERKISRNKCPPVKPEDIYFLFIKINFVTVIVRHVVLQ